ncbi:hypothetical protein [Vibrio hangzhouensis]|uniref:hypothetical protein n=1 Tax=Vibrio hangzhouensis TaxID=462991 RepID=UPI001C9728B1|nr:hypothetical protein [Vibrio hangzhouensis]MBY6199711.1 hypothetical protein [Vibrio hangzhouensis]
MASRTDLQDWVFDALIHLGGSGSIVDVAKVLWKEHEPELRASGDMFYTWQYDMRWAATKLREQNKIKSAEESPRGVWLLV